MLGQSNTPSTGSGPDTSRINNQLQALQDAIANVAREVIAHGIDGDGPFGGGGAGGVWRSFLSDEYAKSFAKAGGIGLADSVYRSLIAQQEARGAQKGSQ